MGFDIKQNMCLLILPFYKTSRVAANQQSRLHMGDPMGPPKHWDLVFEDYNPFMDFETSAQEKYL